MPPEVQARIDALPLNSQPLAALVVNVDAKHKADVAAATTPDEKKTADQAYQQAMSELDKEATTRSVLRDLYSPDQLKEVMTWFWFNHFNVHSGKNNVRVMVGDYEDGALRPHALGHFRDLLEATLRHPAMLSYLDNAQNASGKINENYAREIMELHTMGVGSGYTQKDVQELARVLTGVGIDTRPVDQGPKIGPARAGDLIREGIFEFNPNRHDYGDKVFLGHVIKGRGFGEVEEALDILSRQPATAHHVSEELAVYFVSDTPPEALVQRMAATFTKTNGDIPQVLRTMFHSAEFTASLGTKFKDPMHYVISAVRLAYPDHVVLNTQPIQGWLNQAGRRALQPRNAGRLSDDRGGLERTWARWIPASRSPTPSAPTARACSSPISRARSMCPALSHVAERALLSGVVGHARALSTRAVLTKADSPQAFNALFLSSPDFMRR